jgi:hypothetical protein
MEAEIPFFSPIAQSHAIIPDGAEHLRLDHEFWMKMDGPLMAAAGGLLVMQETGWAESRGIAEEIRRFTAAGKPIVYWLPTRPMPIVALKRRRSQTENTDGLV